MVFISQKTFDTNHGRLTRHADISERESTAAWPDIPLSVFKRAMGPVTEKLESIKDQLTSVPQSFGEAYGDQLTGASQDTAETQSAQGSSETLDTVSCEGGRSLTCAREKTLMAALRRMILSLTTRIG